MAMMYRMMFQMTFQQTQLNKIVDTASYMTVGDNEILTSNIEEDHEDVLLVCDRLASNEKYSFS